jgi:RimJ/RimL family protein N-acetyltransferase
MNSILPTAADAISYSAFVTLRDGCKAEIRALRPTDRDDFVAAVGHTSDRTLYRRFFTPRRRFTDAEVSSFVNVDFISHVALVAVLEERGQSRIVGAARYVVIGPGRAEIAFAVVDDHQGQGIGTALVQHLVAIARHAGLEELTADVLRENTPMLKVFEKSGVPLTKRGSRGVVHIALRLCP